MKDDNLVPKMCQVIAFSGIDGCGKTFLSNALFQKLRESGFRVKKVNVYRYLFWDRFIKLLFRQERTGRTVDNVLLRKGQKPFLFQFWPLLALIDHWLLYFFNIFLEKPKYDYIICDRYFYDFLCSFKYLGYGNKFTLWLYRKFYPKATVQILVVVSPATAQKRKRGEQHSLEFLREMSDVYLDLGRELGVKIVENEVSSCPPHQKTPRT